MEGLRELGVQFDSRKSFYGKAKVYTDNRGVHLCSYGTVVASLLVGKSKPVVFGTYSQTTLRHIKEFLRQYGYKAETASQILKDYGKGSLGHYLVEQQGAD